MERIKEVFPLALYFPCDKCDKAIFLSLLSRHNWYKRVFFPLFSLFIGDNEDKTALYSLFSRLDWHKTVVFPCLGEIYEGIRSLSWEIPVT